MGFEGGFLERRIPGFRMGNLHLDPCFRNLNVPWLGRNTSDDLKLKTALTGDHDPHPNHVGQPPGSIVSGSMVEWCWKESPQIRWRLPDALPFLEAPVSHNHNINYPR